MSKCSTQTLDGILADLFSMADSGELNSLEDVVEIIEEYGLSFKDIFTSKGIEVEIENLKVLLRDTLGIDPSKLVDDNYEETSTVNNISNNFRSSNIASLFHTMQTAEQYFRKSANEKIIRETLLGRGSKYVSTNEELNKNIKSLKNELFNTIRKYLRKPPVDLYREDGTFNVENYEKYYVSTMTDFENAMLIDSKIESPFGNKIPNLRSNIGIPIEILDAYNAAVMLLNFDNVIDELFEDLIDIDRSVFNDFEDSPSDTNKYKSKIKGITELYWKNEDQLENSVERSEAKLSKLVIESIKYYDKNGNFNGEYMELKDVYSFAALLKDFEIVNYGTLKSKFSDWVPFNENSEKALQWYMNKIKEYHNDKINIENDRSNKMAIFANSFENKLDFVLSLENFFSKNNIDEKEKYLENENGVKGLINQVINNSVGTTYYIYNASKKSFEVKDLFKQNINVFSIHESIYSHLKVNSTVFTTEKDKAKIKDIEISLENVILDKKENKVFVSDESVSKIKKYIKYKLGISLTIENIYKLLSGLSDPKKNIFEKSAFISQLEGFSSKVNMTAKSIIAEEEKSKAEEKSHAESLGEVLSIPIVREVINRHLDRQVTKPVMNIETLSKEKIPIYKVVNLSYNDVSLLRAHEKHFNGKYYKNIFTTSIDPVLLGTGTKLEAVKGNDNISASDFSIAEQATASFAYDFHKAIAQTLRNPDSSKMRGVLGFSVMLGNYSDKSTILTKIINVHAKFNGRDIPIIKETSDNILEQVRQQSAAYYSDLFNDIFNQYNLLFSIIGYDQTLTVDPNKEEFDANINIISKYLVEHNLQEDLNKAFKTPEGKSLQFIEEVHYSFYKSHKVMGLNQLLVDYYNVFSDADLFKEFVKDQESEVVKKHLDTYNSEYLDLQENSDAEVDQFLKNIGEDVDAYNEKFVIDKRHKILSDSGELNPLMKKWMWINGFFRNEYMYMSGKGEYMHPHKHDEVVYRSGEISSDKNGKKIFSSNRTKTFKTKADEFASFSHQFKLEMTGRLRSMAKRNVAFTSTFELPVRKSKFGVPENINLAVIEDYKSPLATYGGITKDQEVHDGSSMINYVFSRLVNASYPAKGYGNTKKQFGTLISSFGAAVKKDAETVITNNSIRDSHDGPIKLRSKQEQMLSIPIGNISIIGENTFNNYISTPLSTQLYKDGVRYRVSKYKIENGNMSMVLIKMKNNDPTSEEIEVNYTINNLFHIWNAFGGEFSINENGDWSEGSNEMLYDIVTSYTDPDTGEYVLKDKMIHIISNKSAIKSGSTNLNSSKQWTEPNGELMYSSYEYRHMGPQLDAGHDADGSEVREITQVISALSQNMNTAEAANEVYNNLAKIIENAARPYRHIFKKIEEDKEKAEDSVIPENKQDTLYQYVAKRFFESITRGGNVSLARTIIESFPSYVQIPYSNQNFFQLFVKNVITQLNDEFISRYYSGIGAVLNPSHGIIQIYENEQGETFIYSDLAKSALKRNLAEGLSNEEIVNNYILSRFKDKEVSIDEIVPEDTIIENGVLIPLNDIKTYYNYKNKYKGQRVLKSYKTPRDLKPSEITFKIEADPNPEVVQLFESNPELANAIYEALGFEQESNYYEGNIKPESDTIFVFGSNPEGRHGAGAAKVAREQFGAVYGQGEGLQGNAYALPTKDLRVKENKGFKSISPEQITNSIKKLYEIAKQNPNKQFKVAYRNTTDTSLNGYTGLEMIEMFNQAGTIPSNVIFSKEWVDTNKLSIQSKITPQQKQQAQQLYSHYLEQTGKQDIEGFNEYLSDNPETLKKSVNVFDLDSVRLTYSLQKLVKEGVNSVPELDRFILEELSEYLRLDRDLIKNSKELAKYLQIWTQRNLDLLNNGRVLKSVEKFIIYNDNGSFQTIDFDKLFVPGHFKNNIFDDLKETYTDENTDLVFDYKFKAAELILPNIYKSDFDTGNASVSEIRSQGYEFFAKKLERYYSSSDTNNDIEIVLDGGNRKISIRYVEELPAQSSDVKIVRDVDKTTVLDEDGVEQEELTEVFNRVDERGNRLYTVFDNMRVKIEGGKEIILVKAFSPSMVQISKKDGIEVQDVYYKSVDEDLFLSLKRLINSFSGKISAIVPLMNSDINTEVAKEVTKGKIKLFPDDIHRVTLNIFKHYSGYTSYVDRGLDETWLKRYKDSVITQLAKKKYASWEKSLEHVAARIPSQSLQSFMEMKNVAYHVSDSNDAYVSVFQILLQGSDFDIDKAYIIGYGFDKNSTYETSSSTFNYESKSQLDILEQLPAPTKTKVLWSEDSKVNLTSEFFTFLSYIKRNRDKFNSNIFSDEVLLAFKSALQKIKETKTRDVYILDPLTESIKDLNFDPVGEFITILNSHNSSNNLVTKRHALKNSVVYNIRSIVSSATNQLLANTPVEIESLREAVENNSRILDDKKIKPAKKEFVKVNVKQVISGGQTEIDTIGLQVAKKLGITTGGTAPKGFLQESKDGKGTINNKKLEEYGLIEIADDVQEEFSNRENKKDPYTARTEQNVKNSDGTVYFYSNKKGENDKGGRLATKASAERLKRPYIENPTEEELRDWIVSNNIEILNVAGNRGSKLSDELITKATTVLTNVLGNIEPELEFVEETPSPYKYLSSWDMFSMFKQQQDASVGKKDVGIAANGLKVFFALSNYYNTIYTLDKNSQTPLQGNSLRYANHTFLKKLYLPFIKDNEVTWQTKNFTSISDTKLSQSQLAAVNAALGSDSEAIKAQAALMLSAFTSAATDNAKELLMAKMNANVELASMHLYMLSLGISADQVVYFMTSEIAQEVVKALNTNIFESGKKKTIFINTVLDDLKDSGKFSGNLLMQLDTFKDIYNAAQEFKVLARIFKVNQKVSANIVELYTYLYSFNSAMYARENDLFTSKELEQLKTWHLLEDPENGSFNNIKEKIARKIIRRNNILRESPEDIGYVISVLDKVSKINYKGKFVSILGGQFDFRKYFSIDTINQENNEYKEATKEYYNLIKNTVNIFDVIDRVPHFKAMINGLVISHNILLNSSKKYNFVFNDAVDLNQEYNESLTSLNSEIKNMFGNKNFPVKDTDRQIRRRMMTYDKFLFSKWAKSYKIPDDDPIKKNNPRHISKFSFNVAELLEISEKPSIILIKDDEAASYPMYDTNGKLNSKYYIEIKKNDDGVYENADFTVDLLSDSGIANFKVLMEEVILDILKKDEYANDFIDSLRIQSVKNPYDLITNQIVVSFNISQLNNPINIEKFQNLLSDFNSLESVKQITNKNGERLNWRDLFYVYNLSVNNEGYGDKRLTPIFEDYMKERNSVAFDFLMYSSKVDSGQIDVFEIDEDEITGEHSVPYELAKAARDYSILYSMHHEKGVLNLKNPDNSNNTIKLNITNPNYTVITSLTQNKQVLDKIKNLHTILSWVKSNALVVTFKCD